jgi:hypothetical protein
LPARATPALAGRHSSTGNRSRGTARRRHAVHPVSSDQSDRGAARLAGRPAQACPMARGGRKALYRHAAGPDRHACPGNGRREKSEPKLSALFARKGKAIRSKSLRFLDSDAEEQAITGGRRRIGQWLLASAKLRAETRPTCRFTMCSRPGRQFAALVKRKEAVKAAVSKEAQRRSSQSGVLGQPRSEPHGQSGR